MSNSVKVCLLCLLIVGLFNLLLLPASAHQSNHTVLLDAEIARLKHTAHRLYFTNRVQGEGLFRKLNHRLLASDWEQKYHIFELEPQQVLAYREQGLKVEPALTFIEQQQQRVYLSTKNAKQTSKTIPDYPCYETVEETFAEAERLSQQYPTLVEWVDIGDSQQKAQNAQGYDLMVMIISDQQITEDKPKMFVHAAMHAREYATAPLALRFAKHLLENFSSDADIQQLVQYNETHILFHMNPDGRKRAESGLLWRKNVNENFCSNVSTNVGVDLNRNFTFKWNTVPEGSSGNECSEIYRGPSPASESETVAVENYMKSIFEDVRGEAEEDAADTNSSGLHIDIHSYGEFILWPWGDKTESSPNNVALENLGHKLAFFNGYSAIQSADFYPTDGTSEGISYGELGIPHYTFEVGTAFFQDCETFNTEIVPDNMQAFLYALRVTRQPYQLPFGPDVIGASFNGVATNEITTASNPELQVSLSTQRGSINTTEVRAVRFSIDTPIWRNDAALTDMTVAATVASSTIDISGLSLGEHTVFVQAENQNDQLGPVYAFKLTRVDAGEALPSEPETPEPEPADSDDSGGGSLDPEYFLFFTILFFCLRTCLRPRKTH